MAGPFPTTQWSLFSDVASGDTSTRHAAMEALAAAYWKPIYAYIRARWADSDDQARDLTQDFFLWAMETGFLTRPDRERGRFRAFAKVALKHYLGMAGRKDRTLKRGGATTLVPLDAPACAALTAEATGKDTDPERLMDEVWTAELVRRATAELQRTYEAEGKATYFRVFRDYYLEDSEELDYKAAAAKHGITVTDVSNYLMNAKRRFRGILRGLVAETVGDAGELDGELRDLFGGGGS